MQATSKPLSPIAHVEYVESPTQTEDSSRAATPTPPLTTTPPSYATNPNPVPIPNVRVIEKAQMCEINPGVWDGFSPEQAMKYYPEEWERFLKDPYAFRAPRAESYHDLCGEFGYTTLRAPPLRLYIYLQYDWSLS
jgi:hypothetical protein